MTLLWNFVDTISASGVSSHTQEKAKRSTLDRREHKLVPRRGGNLQTHGEDKEKMRIMSENYNGKTESGREKGYEEGKVKNTLPRTSRRGTAKQKDYDKIHLEVKKRCVHVDIEYDKIHEREKGEDKKKRKELHFNSLISQVSGDASQVGLPVHCSIWAHIVCDIGNVHSHLCYTQKQDR